jgi:prevent-host-death family protein
VQRHDTNLKGSIAELEIAAAATRLGIGVLAPMTEHGRYDLVFDFGARLLRVQCKWASLRGAVVQISLTGNYHTPRGYVRSVYRQGEIDAVAAYCGELDSCYLLPAAMVTGRRAVSLRREPPRNGQRAALNWASDYELGAIAQLGERVAGAHEFRERFGWYMERAAAGEEIRVTRWGRPYVRLSSADAGAEPSLID